MSETPATELDAVNVILENMGEAPVDSLSGDLPLDALKAQRVLHEISRELQNRGWTWNQEVRTLSVDANDNIVLPTNTLAVKRYVNGPYLTIRDGKLYRIQVDNNGDTFTEAQKVILTLFVPYEDMPPIAQRYITLKAARVHQARELGNELLLREDTVEEQLAWAELKAEDNANSRRSLKQALDVRMITDRQGPVLIK